MVKKFELFVIGGGSGGVRAARYAAANGIKTGIAEGWSLGGTCVNRGCIPKKLYTYASNFSEEMELMQSFGWKLKNKSFSWKKLVSNKKKEIKRLNNICLNLLSNSNVKIFSDFAEFVDNKILRVGNDLIQAESYLIAVGTKPKNLGLCKENKLISSDEAFDIEDLPENILILGGGYIAIEFASIFKGLGVDVTVCIRGNRILKDFDSEVSDFLSHELKEKGIKILNNDFPKEIIYSKNKYKVFFKKNTKIYQKVLEATGRIPNIDKLKIHNTKVHTARNKSIIINDYFQTSQKNIFAVGDVVDRVQLTPVAISEAMTVIDNLKSKKKKKFNYHNIPTAVFSYPNYAFVGFSEHEAKKKFTQVEVFKSIFTPLKYSMSKIKSKVFIKLIVSGKQQRIRGIHYIGENAAEIIQGFSVAAVNGLTKKQLDRTLGIHPTSAEEIVTLKNKQY